jgi:DegV family protein with EDD domain
MPGVRIVTDSSCDLTQQEAAELGVEIVPLSIRFGNEEYTDRDDLTVEDFYKKMAVSDRLPETAAPSPGAFEQAFRNAHETGADAVVCVTISSKLSATMQSALNAVQAIGDEFPVHVIDSKSITSGLGTIVIEAARAAASGADATSILETIDDLISRTRVFGALNTLENLKKGGRIGGAQALLGSMLSIKPIVDISTGEVQEAGKARTRKKAMLALRDRLRAEMPVEHLAVVHGEAPDLEEFYEVLAEDVPPGSYRTAKIGAVIGTHGGPEILGLTWIAHR